MLDNAYIRHYAEAIATRRFQRLGFEVEMSAPLGNGNYHPFSITLWDKSREKGVFEAYSAVVTATIVSTAVVNFTAQSTAWSALNSSVLGITRGLIYSARWVNQNIFNAYPPDEDINQEAVREIGLKVMYIDDTTQKKLEVTVPTLDLSKVTYLSQAKDFVAVTAEQGAGAEIVSFVTDFEAFVVNPGTGNPVTVVGLKVVGRNN